MQRTLWVEEWVRCISAKVHFREIGLGISLQLIINGIDADIRRKFVALGIWIGACINELQLGSEGCPCSDLPNVSEA
jgi:hypothetical protein